jgi:hypothetical protein
MPTSHDDLAPTGSYSGPPIPEDRPGTDQGAVVRAPKAEDERDTSQPADRTVQLSFSAEQSRYRLRGWLEGMDADDPDGYTELRRCSEGELAQALEHLPDKPRFVVFENTDTGEVFLGRENNLGDNWTGGGKYDQVTLFEDETDAADYAKSRQDNRHASAS